jgi:outer membrane protein assembly factor BamB
MRIKQLSLALVASAVLSAQVSVLTHHNDNARTGANLRETSLNTLNVNREHFGKLASRPVDGNIYAQPLVVAGARAANRKAPTDLVIVATEHNSVYAFDANNTSLSPARALVWHTGPAILGRALDAESLYSNIGADECTDITTEIGITSTPVIGIRRPEAPAEGVIFVTAKSKSAVGYRYMLFALNLANGAVVGRIPVEGEVRGEGVGSTGTGSDAKIRFDAGLQLNRPGLLLANDILYIAFGGHCDTGEYHGWVFAYNVSDPAAPQEIGVWCTSPNGRASGEMEDVIEGRAGIWMSGAGPAMDDDGHIYLSTGNGTSSTTDLGDSLVHLRSSPAGISVEDWYTPPDEEHLKENDLDFGSTGSLLIPGSRALITGDKGGHLYLFDRTNLGKNTTPPVQSIQVTQSVKLPQAWSLHGSPVIWPRGNEIFAYVTGEESPVTQFRLVSDASPSGPGWKFDPPAPIHVSDISAPFPKATANTRSDSEEIWMPGGFMALSADGVREGTGILWVTMPLEGNANHFVTRGVLRAFDASDLSKPELWDSESTGNARDHLGQFAKFCPPTVANGKVYVATFQQEIITPAKRHLINRKGDHADLVIYGLM